MGTDIFDRLPAVLLPWYDRSKRDLPWRRDREPYHVWLSEIMLQQTRVEAVRDYYIRFLAALPTVEALAQAEDSLLEKLWEGLGYYSRVRNLKKAACRIMEQWHGRFPETYEGVRSLPGIGPYTAGAICSISYNMPTPAVDGNVLRLVSRLCDDPTPIDLPAVRKRTEQALARIYPDRAGDFTQALMELGATVCGPNRAPDCCACPCQDFCLGYQRKTAAMLPVKNPKATRKREKLTVLILHCDGMYALQRRPDTGLLAGLWEFPNLPGWLEVPQILDVVEQMGLKASDITMQVERKHVFTHIEWEMRGIFMDVKNCAGNFCWMDAAQIDGEAALPTAFRQFWQEEQQRRSGK